MREHRGVRESWRSLEGAPLATETPRVRVPTAPHARVAKLVNAPDSKSGSWLGLRVRAPPRAHRRIHRAATRAKCQLLAPPVWFATAHLPLDAGAVRLLRRHVPESAFAVRAQPRLGWQSDSLVLRDPRRPPRHPDMPAPQALESLDLDGHSRHGDHRNSADSPRQHDGGRASQCLLSRVN